MVPRQTAAILHYTAAVKRVVGRGEAILAAAAIWAGTARQKVPPPPSHSIVRGTSCIRQQRRGVAAASGAAVL